MALFDIMNEISEKQFTKTALGEERMFGLAVGIVVENYSSEMPGRVCVSIPVRDENANELKWAKVAAPSAGSGWGHYFLPEKQDQVLLAFENGNIEKPYVVGCIPRDNDRFLKKSADEKNTGKIIQTRNGSRILFEDGDGQAGAQKDKITLVTGDDKHRFIMDNENKKLVLADQEDNCRIEMKTENGQLEIHAAKKLVITVGDSIKIKMNGDSGGIQVEAVKLTVKTSKSASVEADGSLKLSGKQLTAEAASSLKLDSSGIVTVSGSPVKIG